MRIGSDQIGHYESWTVLKGPYGWTWSAATRNGGTHGTARTAADAETKARAALASLKRIGPSSSEDPST